MSTRSSRRAHEPLGSRTNVVGGASSFVGRATDRAAIAERFEDGAQLVTITGPGGMGKTRVALRFAEDQLATYGAPGAGGVWFCDLTGARSVMAACAEVAAVLGVRLDGGAPERKVAEDLGRAIGRRKRVLVVLDNFEQLAEHADATIERWTRLAPSARLLVTSRIALGITGEHLWPLDPLPLPPTGVGDAASLSAVESVDLFVRRARQVRPDLRLADEDLGAIAEVVRRLDGIPLAIELAAARVGVLSVAQLRDRLAARLDVLVRRGDAGRHASMRRALVDSYELLGPAEQACFARCAVFVSGFSLDAAEAALGGAGPPALAMLETLCAHSLVRAVPCPELGGELRFSLFETVRELAAERLAASPELAAAAAERHAAHYAAAGRALAARAASEGGGEAAARLGQELDNILAAHATALADPTPVGAARALSLALAADPVLTKRGLFRLRLRLLDDAIQRARASGAIEGSEIAAALLARGRAGRELGGMARARADFEEGLTLADAAGIPALAARAHTGIGELVEIDGATRSAREHFARALACLAAAPGDPAARHQEADVRAHVAHAYRREGALEDAEREIDVSIGLYRAGRHAEGLAMALYEAAVVALFRERYDEARGRFEEALALVQERGARQAEGALLAGLGVLLQERGDLDEALRHHQRAVDIFREVGNRHREVSATYYLAATYLERGQRDDAANLIDRALPVVRELGVPRYEALLLSCRATLFAAAGDLDTAARTVAFAEKAAAACHTEVALAAAVAIHGLSLSMQRADVPARERHLAQARALVRAHPSDDPRFALRALLACSAPTREDPARPLTAPLRIRAQGRAFRVPGSPDDIDLERRVPLRRLLHALARKRVDAPGEPLALDELLAAGWPGERIRGSAGSNRVYVALTTLRNLGLRGFLRSGPEGYSLTTACPCDLEADE